MKIKNSAITLIELIIATLIVSMVVAGVFSAEYALRRTNENSAGDAQTSVQTKSLAGAIRSAVKTAHGAIANPPGTGISISGAPNPTLCFRQDVNVAGSPTPDNYNDDNWLCFTQRNDSLVYRCFTGTSPGSCQSPDPFVGALVSDQFTNPVITALGPTVTVNATTGECSFKITLVGRRDPSVGAAITAGSITSGTDANPQTVVKVLENCTGF